jgi:hypothetical protein
VSAVRLELANAEDSMTLFAQRMLDHVFVLHQNPRIHGMYSRSREYMRVSSTQNTGNGAWPARTDRGRLQDTAYPPRRVPRVNA